MYIQQKIDPSKTGLENGYFGRINNCQLEVSYLPYCSSVTSGKDEEVNILVDSFIIVLYQNNNVIIKFSLTVLDI